MSIEQWVSLTGAAMSFIGLVFVALQIRHATRQRWVDSMQRLSDNNRELLTLGFQYPKLFDILNDRPGADPEWQRRYLQLWLNHLMLVHTILKHRGFDADFREGLEADIAETVSKENMQLHWLRVGKYCPASFQKRVNSIIAKLDGL